MSQEMTDWTKRRDELAESEHKNADGSIGYCPECFKAGYDQARKDMLEEMWEFDSFEARDYAEGLAHIQEQGATYTFGDGARWQFEQIKKKLGLG